MNTPHDSQSTYQQYLRTLDPTLYNEEESLKTNPFALETFGIDPRTTEVDENFGYDEYDEVSSHLNVDRFGLVHDRRYLPFHKKQLWT
uniref:Uncharacterized protein n=1 Tax=Nephroselmis olivacea TaxID=31312 RepID=Q9TKX1_NEPOL|nr:hypothetical protein NeolCp069 [Nephroselmis olivacea]AAD54845.1 unknown [Nephroselmis olivacea]